ncbi:hypothetical protein EYF80_050565 [Liparis tanakae]|uniref:Uncharacterized protein n=1 Tax=Liparis tanakae TaxID=230148 RepID=A0A4Z2FEV0_9TELE|nr:hypothetical protein EYF80_050565 [Liparis tanakae]
MRSIFWASPGNRKLQRNWLQRARERGSVIPDDGLVEALAFVEELGDVFGGVLQEVVLQQELDALENHK